MLQPTAALVTFGDGAPRYRRAARRLEREARSSGWFADIQRWDARRLSAELGGFVTEHRAILAPGSRGFGYWIWKPGIVAESLRRLSTDVVVFLDAGCVLNVNDASTDRLRSYLRRAVDEGLLATQLDLSEALYSKRDLLDRVGLDETQRWSGQFQGGILFAARTGHTEDLVAEWLELCGEDGYRYLDDSPSTAPNPVGFVAHRHDQSIFSCLAKVHGIGSMPDETYFKGAWERDGANYPIWAPRHAWGRPFPGDEKPGLSLRLERRLLR